MHDAMRSNPRHRKVTLTTLNNGEAVEKFAMAFEQILADMVSPNKDPDAKRKITMTFEFQANKRKSGSRFGDSKVRIGCTSKLADYLSDEGTLVISASDDGPEAHQDAYQEDDLDNHFTNRNNGRSREVG